MNVTGLNRSGLNMSRLNASLLNAGGMGCIGCKGKATIEDKIRESMVLWYDLAKQGATNESMAADPRLIDLSGNGHDATCYNFAWNLKSGISADTVSVNQFTLSQYSILSDGVVSYSRTIESGGGWDWIMKLPLVRGNSYNIIINCSHNNPKNINFNIRYNGQNHMYVSGTTAIVTLTKIDFEGELLIEVPISIVAGTTATCAIEQGYPHALVSDGVDDYCLVKGLPLLNKEDGYTVIAKRKWLTEDLTVESLMDKCFLSDMPAGGEPYGGAYAIELNLSNGCNAQSCGSRTIVNISEDDIVYQTSQSYCGQNIKISSDFVEGNGLFNLFRFKNSYRAPIALNSILLFNRDLSTDEIDWVKTNLITE